MVMIMVTIVKIIMRKVMMMTLNDGNGNDAHNDLIMIMMTAVVRRMITIVTMITIVQNSDVRAMKMSLNQLTPG